MADVVRITIDGIAYRLAFRGFDAAMTASSPSGATIEFKPWPFGGHLASLDECAMATSAGLRLDEAGFGRRLLAYCGVHESMHEEFLPLALWWATGGGESKRPFLQDGLHDFGAYRARLRPWNGGERYEALSRCRSEDKNGGMRFNLGAYLRFMLEASIVSLDPPDLALYDLNASEANALLDAVLEMNVVDTEEMAASPLYAPEAARQTLRLCRELGWPPSRVWATPAAELDRLSTLLDSAQAPISVSRHNRPTTLADHPDAFVIRIEDD